MQLELRLAPRCLALRICQPDALSDIHAAVTVVTDDPGKPHTDLASFRGRESDGIGLILLLEDLGLYAAPQAVSIPFPAPFDFNGLEVGNPRPWPIPRLAQIDVGRTLGEAIFV